MREYVKAEDRHWVLKREHLPEKGDVWLDLDLTDLPGEEWKTVPEFEDYQVSNKGRVKCRKRIVNWGNSEKEQPERIVKQSQFAGVSKYNTYLGVDITSSGKKKHYQTHVLVLMCFKPNTSGQKLESNHIDGDNFNNCVDNLEWCSHSDNIFHSYKNKLDPKGKPVIDTTTGKIYYSINEAARDLGVNADVLARSVKQDSLVNQLFGKYSKIRYLENQEDDEDDKVFLDEVWRDVLGFEGVYQISNYGRVKRLSHTFIKFDGKSCVLKEKFLNIHSKENHPPFGYVILKEGEQYKEFLVKKLLLQVFTEDEIKTEEEFNQ